MSIAYSSDHLPERKITHPELVRLRDGFAKAVLPACYEAAIQTLEHEGYPEENWRVGVALDAYQMADAMLVARSIER